jgi:arsenate reductase-like glutaredoxin family protein
MNDIYLAALQLAKEGISVVPVATDGSKRPAPFTWRKYQEEKPTTQELIDWLSLLMADDMPEDVLRNRDTSKAIPPLYGALIKNEQDVQLLERLSFMSRR